MTLSVPTRLSSERPAPIERHFRRQRAGAEKCGNDQDADPPDPAWQLATGGECRGDEPRGAGADRTGRSGAHPPDRAVSGAAADRRGGGDGRTAQEAFDRRSEEHTSELQSLMRNSYAVF